MVPTIACAIMPTPPTEAMLAMMNEMATEEQALQRGVAQHDGGVVLLATEASQRGRAPIHRAHPRGRTASPVPRLRGHQHVGDDADDRTHSEGDAGLGDDVIDGQRPGNTGLRLLQVLLRVGLRMHLLCTVACGSGTELCVSALLFSAGCGIPGCWIRAPSGSSPMKMFAYELLAQRSMFLAGSRGGQKTPRKLPGLILRQTLPVAHRPWGPN